MSLALRTLPYALSAYNKAKRLRIASPSIQRAKLYGSVARMAARTIWRGYKRYRRRRRNRSSLNSKLHVGPRPGVTNAKRTTEKYEYGLANSRQVYQNPLFALARGTGTNQREQNLVNWRGTKVCIEYENLANEPMYFKFAVLVPKSQGPPTTTALLRGTDGSRAKDLDFTTMSGLDTVCPPFNVDLYTVLMNQTFRMCGTTAQYRVGGLKTYGYYERYIKMNRQIRYDTTSTLAAQQPWIVCWFEKFNAATGTPKGAGDVKFNVRTVTYFKDP